MSFDSDIRIRIKQLHESVTSTTGVKNLNKEKSKSGKKHLLVEYRENTFTFKTNVGEMLKIGDNFQLI